MPRNLGWQMFCPIDPPSIPIVTPMKFLKHNTKFNNLSFAGWCRRHDPPGTSLPIVRFAPSDEIFDRDQLQHVDAGEGD